MEWNKPSVPPSALVLSHLSSQGQIDRYKLIFLHPFQDSPENILCSHARTIVSFSSFNRATVIYYLRYGSSKRLTPMDRYLRYYEKCNSQARKFLSPPPPQSTLVLCQAKFQRPGFRRLSSGIGPWRRRCKFVANSANAQDQRVYIHTFHLSVHLKSNQSWNYEIIMSKSQGVFVRFIATFYFARLPRTGLRYVIGYSFLVYFASLNC